MPAVVNAMKEEATLVTLGKPQFEAHRSQVRNKLGYLSNLWKRSSSLFMILSRS